MSQTKDQDSKREFSVTEKKSLTKTRPKLSRGKKKNKTSLVVPGPPAGDCHSMKRF